MRELAEKAGVTANTVTRIENGADAKQSTMDRLQYALEAAGVEFIDENGGGPGVRLRKRSRGHKGGHRNLFLATRPSSVAAIHSSAGCRTCRWTTVMA